MELNVLQQVRQLAQAKPPNTNAMSLIAKVIKRKVVVMNMIVCNQTANSATWSVFVDRDGTTYDTTTALFYNNSLAANTSALVEFVAGLPIDPQAAGNLAVQVGTANAITFTVNGIEV